MSTWGIVVAGGTGSRFGTAKQFESIAGARLVDRAVETATGACDDVVVVLPDGFTWDGARVTAAVVGGATRSASVRAGLTEVPASATIVVVHDAARPLLTPALVEDCLRELETWSCDAAIAAAAVTDTIKETLGEEVVRTLDRTRLWAVQTPQAFRRDALERALDQPHEVLAAATDDASLVEALGGTVRVVPAPRENFKVTTPLDLWVAELLLREA